MIVILAWIVAIILSVLSVIHVYWMLGGSKGIEAAVPSRDTGVLFQPSKFATALVAFLLALTAAFVLELGGVIASRFPNLLLTYGGWLLSAVFILRAIGDFKWLGVFKSKKGTMFARWDTVLYSPLCCVLGLAVLIITVL